MHLFWKTFRRWLAIFLLIYFFVANIRWRFANPEMTETQLFLTIPHALMWSSVKP